jgi:hypothetical protein
MVSCPALSTGYAAAAPAPCAVGQGAQKVSSVLNVDDEYVMQMANRTRQLIVTFGMERDADGRVVQLEEAFPDPLMLIIASRHGTYQIATMLVSTCNWPSIAAAYAQH